MSYRKISKRGLVILTFLFFVTFSPIPMIYAQGVSDVERMLAAPQSLSADPVTGTATMSVPIDVPPGRAGIQPQLALSYNSSNGNSWVGIGWMLDLGAIYRSTQKGGPQYNSQDTFISSQNGSHQPLVDISGIGKEYRSKLEGAFLKFEFINNEKWVVTDKSGTKYYFGTTADSRIFDPNTSSRIARWNLDRVEDLNGNFMQVTYARELNELYLQDISYTGNSKGSIPAFARIHFSRGDRPDILGEYSYRFRTILAQRLAKIEVFANENCIHRYDLGYTQDPQTGRSLLKTITPVGADGVTTLPATTFNYSAGSTDLLSAVALSHYPSEHVASGLVRLMDMNADGLPDLVKATANNYQIYFNQASSGTIDFAPPIQAVNPQGQGLENPNTKFVDLNSDGLLDVIDGNGCPYWVSLNNGVNGFQPAQRVINCPDVSLGDLNRVQFADMNADGILDMLQTADGPYKLFLNDGTGNFLPSVAVVNSPRFRGDNPDLQFGDFNGDGLLDVIYGATSPYKIWINNGQNGFLASKTVSFSPAHSVSYEGRLRFVDMNGDGLMDLLDGPDSKNDEWQIYFNNGNVDFEAPVAAANSVFSWRDDINTKVFDMNGDGLLDLFCGSPSFGVPYQVRLNNGYNGFRPPIFLTNYPSSGIEDAGNMLVDLNGDGLTDLLWGSNQEFPYKVYLSQSTPGSSRTAVLVSTENGVGGTTSIDYKGLPISGLIPAQYKVAFSPILFNSIRTVTRKTGQGDTYKSEYVLKQGLWDPASREFRGFGYVKEIDPAGTYSETRFLQDDIFKGRPSEQSQYDSAGNLYAKVVNQWNSVAVYPNVNFAFLKKSDRFFYDGNSTGKRTQEEFFYEETPQQGNLTKSVSYGEVDLATGADVGSDKTIREVEYLNDALNGHWLIGFPKHTVLKDHTGSVIKQSWLYYDGNTDFNIIPTKGQLSKRKDWGGIGASVVHPETKYTYDSYGNLTATQDPKNNTTTVTYDNVFKMFPMKTVNPKGHEVINEYYGIAGIPVDSGDGFRGICGQLKSTTDPNSQKGRKSYDTFGRLKATVSPLDSIALPTSSMEYEPLTQYTKIKAHKRVNSGEPATLDTVHLFDGLGRLIQSKSSSEVVGRFIISGQTEYDSRGLPVKKYLPYFTTSGLDTIDPIDPAKPHTLLSYDAMGRIIQTTYPDGTYASVSYEDWTTTTIDPNGHKQVSTSDAQGRLIQKDEYTGADGRSPHYPAQAFQLYARTYYTYDSQGNLKEVKDAKGNITTVSYDTLGRKTAMNDPDMGAWSYLYDLNSNLDYQTDAKAQGLDFSYDVVNRLMRKTNSSILDVNYTYDDTIVNYSKGRLTKAAYAMSQDTQFHYDLLGREIKSTKKIDAMPYTIERSYNDLDQILKIKYPDQKNIFYKYNSAGQVEKVSNDESLLIGDQSKSGPVLSDEKAPKLVLSGLWPTIKKILREIPVSEMVDNILGIKEAYAQGAGTSLPDPWKSQDIGSVGKVGSAQLSYPASEPAGIFVINASGADINTTADGFHFMYQPLNGDGEILTRVKYISNTNEWAKAGVMVREGLSANAKNVFIGISYSKGSVFQSRETTGGTTALTASDKVKVPYWVKLVRAGNNFSVYKSSDGTKWIKVGSTVSIPMSGVVYIGLAVTSHNNTVLNTSYVGSVSVKQAPPVPVLNTATALDSKVSLSWSSSSGALGYKIKYGTASGNYSTTLDVGNVTSYQVSNLTNVTPYFFVVSSYNTNGNSVNSNEVSATPVGQFVEQPTLFVKNIDYNAFGQMIKIEYGNGHVTNYTYHSLNMRLTNIQTTDSGGNVIQDLSYAYDPAGNILSITDRVNTATQSFQYDALNRLVQASGRYGNKNYSYDEIGNLLLKDGINYTYGQNGAGPHAVTSGSDGSTFSYDPNGNMISMYKDGNNWQYSYDAENHMTEVRKNSLTVAQYAYDGDGGRTKKTVYDYSGGVASRFLEGTPVLMADGSVKSIEAIKSGDAIMSVDLATLKKTKVKVKEVNRRPLVLNEYFLVNGNTKIAANSLCYSEGSFKMGSQLTIHDKLLTPELTEIPINEIKLIKDKIKTTVYNLDMSENTTFFAGGYLVQNKVDPESRFVSNHSDGLFDLNQFSHYSDRIMDFLLGSKDAEAAIPGATSKTTYFVGSLYEEDSLSQTNHIFVGNQRIVSLVNGRPLYSLTDHLGGTNILIDEMGVIKELCEYEPFGSFSRHERYGDEDERAWNLFTGQHLDDETGLYFYGARYYNPTIGRFLTADDIVPSPGSSQGYNRYSYVYNNPVALTDPSGNFPWLAFAIGAIIGGASSGIQSYQETGEVNWGSFALGAAIGGLSGAALSPATTAASMQITAFKNTSMFLLQSSAVLTLGSQMVGASGASNASRYMGMGGQYLGFAFLGLQIGVGVANSLAEKSIYYEINSGENMISGTSISKEEIIAKYGKTGANIFTNGAGMNIHDSLKMAAQKGANILHYNPTHGIIPDFTEAGIGLFFHTDSLSRDLGNLLTKVKLNMIGYSQGTIIGANAMLFAGLHGGAGLGSTFIPFGKAVGMGRLGYSSFLSGVTILYGEGQTAPLDAIRAVSSELNPLGYAQGALGIATGIGFKEHLSY